MLFYEKVSKMDWESHTSDAATHSQSHVSSKKMHTSTASINMEPSGSLTTAKLEDPGLQDQSDLKRKNHDKYKEDKPKGDKASEEKPKEDKTKGDKSKGDNTKGHKSKGDKTSEEKPNDKTKGDKSKEDKTKGDESKGGKSVDLLHAIQEALRYENTQIKRVRYSLYGHSFDFLRALMTHDIVDSHHYRSLEEQVIPSIEHAVKLLPLNFSDKSRIDMRKLDEWRFYIQNLLKYSKEASIWALKFLGEQANYEYILCYLVEFYDKEIRQLYSQIVISILQSFIDHTANMRSTHLEKAVKQILSLLQKEVPTYSLTCTEYFLMLKQYMLGSKESFTYVDHMLKSGAFQSLMTFLVGPPELIEDNSLREWTYDTAKHFAPHIHSMLATMIVNCDVSLLRPKDFHYQMYPNKKKPPIRMPDDMTSILSGIQCFKYVRESILATCEYEHDDVIQIEIINMLVHCCYCNNDFSMTVLTELHKNIATCPVSQLNPLFHVLLQVLLVEDSFQENRVKMTIQELSSVMENSISSSKPRLNKCLDFLTILTERLHLLKAKLKPWQKAVNSLRDTYVTYKDLAEAMSMLTISDDTALQNKAGFKHRGATTTKPYQSSSTTTKSHQSNLTTSSLTKSHQNRLTLTPTCLTTTKSHQSSLTSSSLTTTKSHQTRLTPTCLTTTKPQQSSLTTTQSHHSSSTTAKPYPGISGGSFYSGYN